MTRPETHSRNAFTLIEMSVVLVIIALLTGGILVGKSLMRQSQVMSVVVDVQRYVKAVQAFQQKYNAMPGDMANATSFWGAAGGNASDNWTTSCYASGSLSSPATCNGNGDGLVYGQNATYTNEMFRFWQQLADAGMIQGTYTGVAGSGGVSEHTIGVNSPATQVKGTGLSFFYQGNASGNGNIFDGSYGHLMQFGQKFATGGPASPALTTVEAQAVDAKYDDGLPATGAVRSFKASSSQAPNCATTAVSTTAAYAVGTTGMLCSLIFITGF